MNDEKPDRLEINWVNSLGSALGAVSSAVVLSTLGTAGTLIGAAVGSLVITIGGALYAHSIRRAGRRITTVGPGPLGRPRTAGSTVALEVTDDDERQGGSRWASLRQSLKELPWKRISLASAALFVAAMVIIVAFELATGRPVSALTGGTSDSQGGTTVPGIGGGREGSDQDEPSEGDTEQTPTDSPEEAPEEETEDGSEEETEDETEEVPPPEEQGPVPAETNTVEPSPTAAPS